MAVVKRLFLFVLVNVLVVATISITTSLLGIRPYLEANGIDYTGLLAFCAIAGFSGAIISLLMSRWMAKFMMGVQVIDPARASAAERSLVTRVHSLAKKAGITTMPEVGIYQSPEVNAFATGPTKNRALVAVSTGLLNSMDESAVDGVLGHEVAHVANGDMVTMTLIQGIVNTFVMFFARIAAFFLSHAMSGDRDHRGPNPWIYTISVLVFDILFSVLGSVVVAYFSRWREYRADRGGAELAGVGKMIHALESLKRSTMIDESHPSVAALKINGRRGGLLALLSTHPDLDDRIAALRNRGRV
jgi:heat shock protein HtpX